MEWWQYTVISSSELRYAIRFAPPHINKKRCDNWAREQRSADLRSDQRLLNEELSRIQNVMESNDYPRGFVKRTIKRQIKKRTGVKLPKEDEKAEKMVNASIPFIEGLSQEVRRIAPAAGVKCTFQTANTLRSVYSAKDRLPKDT